MPPNYQTKKERNQRNKKNQRNPKIKFRDSDSHPICFSINWSEIEGNHEIKAFYFFVSPLPFIFPVITHIQDNTNGFCISIIC